MNGQRDKNVAPVNGTNLALLITDEERRCRVSDEEGLDNEECEKKPQYNLTATTKLGVCQEGD